MGTQLQYDILVSIAEKIIFSPDNEFRLDLRDLAALDFMFVNKACQNSFFFQFRRMEKVYLSNGGLELRSPVPVEGRNPSVLQPQFFSGPFNVNDWLFLHLLQRSVLRLRFVETFYALSDSKPPDSESSEDGKTRTVSDELPAESLIKLLLFKDSPELFKKVHSSDLAFAFLELDFIKITDNAGVFTHLDRILNLDCVEVYVESVGAFPEFIPVKIERVTAKRTKHFTLIYTVDINDPVADTRDFPFAHLRSMLGAIADACVNLERMYVRFCLGGEFSDEDFVVLSNWLQQTIKTLSSETLVDFECNCEVTVAFHAFFPESTLMEANESAHELTQMGEQKLSCSDDEVAVGDEDNLSSSLSGDDTAPSFTIARQLNVDAKRMKRISYSLVGVQEDSTQDDWHGFNGPPAMIAPTIAEEWNGFASDNDENDNDSDESAL